MCLWDSHCLWWFLTSVCFPLFTLNLLDRFLHIHFTYLHVTLSPHLQSLVSDEGQLNYRYLKLFETIANDMSFGLAFSHLLTFVFRAGLDLTLTEQNIKQFVKVF